MPHVDRLWERRFDDWAGFQRMHDLLRLLERAVEEGKEKALVWLKP
jgi:hypothetical protein